MSDQLKDVIAVPEQQAVIVPLKLLVNEILGDSHYRAIEFSLAKAILKCTNNKHTCFVQMPSEDSPELVYPLLWNYQAWVASVERWRLAKEREERERNRRWIQEANIQLVAKHLRSMAALTPDQSTMIANRWLKLERHSSKVDQLGIKLITRIEDI